MDPKYSFGIKVVAIGLAILAFAYLGMDSSWLTGMLGTGVESTVPVTTP